MDPGERRQGRVDMCDSFTLRVKQYVKEKEKASNHPALALWASAAAASMAGKRSVYQVPAFQTV